MKVLVISHNPFSRSSNNGKTLASIFSEFPEGSILQLYFHGSENPDLEFNAKYFRITDKEIIRRFCFIGPKPGCVINDITLGDISRNNFSKKDKFRNIMLSIRDIIWKLTYKKSDRALEWIATEKPDVVFYVGGDSIFSHRLASLISKKLQLPLAVYFTDDYILNSQLNSIFDKIRNLALRRAFRNTVSQAQLCLSIGDAMKKDYSAFFKKEFVTVMNCIDIIPKQEYVLNMKQITISYFGGLHLNRDAMILRFGKIISAIVAESKMQINFYIYSGQIPSDEMLFEFSSHNVKFCGFVRADDLCQKIAKSDFLLHVENDESYYKSLTKLSVSTKIPEYLISSKPIIAFGPPDVASFEMLSKNDIGAVISSYSDDNDIKEQLLDFMSNEKNLQGRVSRAYEYAVTHFVKEKNSKKLYQNLNDLLNENPK